MFHHCNHPIRFGHFEHLELPRRCIVTWHLLAANSKLRRISCHGRNHSEASCEYSLTIFLCCQDPQGGNLKNSEQGGSVYFFGSKIWLKFTFLGKKYQNYFFGLEIFEIIFLGSFKVTKFILGDVQSTGWVTFLYTNHLRRKKKDGSTRYTHTP